MEPARPAPAAWSGGLPVCPFLPVPASPLDAGATGAFRHGERGAPFYLSALLYAQSLWLDGFPAKSLLLINRALGADVRAGDRVLADWPLPYAAAAWVMRERRATQFIGNPRRHYQHLATRMVEPRKELRTWRAWACWLLANRAFPDLPSDELQIERERLVLPARDEVLARIGALGHPGEAALVEAAEELVRQADSA
jgi:hypothetical protein